MRMKLISNGITYVGKSMVDKQTAQDLADIMFDQISNLNRLQLELEDGNFLVIGNDALQNAHLIIEQ